MTQPLVSVIVPYCQEWPQVAFTLRAIHEELIGIPHEVIAVDNFCQHALRQMHNVWKKSGVPRYIDEGHDRPNDKTKEPPSPEWLDQLLAGELEEYAGSRVRGMTKVAKWLRYVRYSEKLSHWNAKNAAVRASSGRLLLFLDAHIVPGRGSLSGMVAAYEPWCEEHGPGSLHAPLTYHILEEHKLIYRLKHNPDIGELHYAFSGYPSAWDTVERRPHEVSCMSCCGVMISREIYDQLGGWPGEMGIYGGGENFLNFTMAVLGMKHWVMAGPPVHHYATHRGRGYHFEYADHKRNQAIAAYMYGDLPKLEAFCFRHPKHKSAPEFYSQLVEDIASSPTCQAQRDWIKSQQKMEIDEWIAAHS